MRRSDRLRRGALLALGLALSQCVHTLEQSPQAATRIPAQIPLFDAQSTVAAGNVVQDKVLEKRRAFSHRQIELEAAFPIRPDEDTVFVEIFEPAQEHWPAPTLIVLPILDGVNRYARYFSRYFANRGYTCVIVSTDPDNTVPQDLEDPDAAVQRTLLRHRQAIRWMEEQPSIDMERLGVFGASLGGMNAVMVAGSEPRTKAVVPIIAGGDFAAVFTQTRQVSVRSGVDQAIAEKGLTREEYEVWLREKILHDPLVYASRIQPEQVLMVMARRDLTVPYATQEALRTALGEPQALLVPTRHRSTFLYMPIFLRRAESFFEERLR